MKFGAIDIGTNAARLLVGEVTKEEGHSFVKKISYTRVPLRLGEEVFENGRISKSKTEDFIKTMHAFKLISEIFQVKELRACATSAMREAKNGEKVKKKIFESTGVQIETISGDEEAELIFGTFFLLEIDKSIPFIVIDVGGGSTEVSVFENQRRVAAKSFEVGTLRILKGKTRDTIWTEIKDWLTEHVNLNSSHRVYGTGGNINKVHKMLGAGHLEPVSSEDISILHNEMNVLSVRQRVEHYQLRPDRADVIVPAMEIYLFIMKEIGCSEIFVPKIGLSDGMIYNLHKKRKKKKVL